MDSGSNRAPRATKHPVARDIPLALIDPNPWNPNRMGPANYARLKRELARGFLAPILVRPRSDRFQIVDGEHRFRLAGELGYAAVPCIVADLTDQDAEIKTLQMNGLRGENDPDRLGQLLADLRARLDPDRLAALLPWSADELEAMAALAAARAGAEVKKIVAGFSPPPVTREIFAAVVPVGGRAEVEAAVSAARLREREEDDGAALVALCRRYLKKYDSTQRRGGAEKNEDLNS